MVKCNLKLVDYLDVTLNLSDGSYKPFHKPNSEINYIHRESNHTSSIIKQSPLSVESRLPKLSSDENVFIQATSVYQESLIRAGYNHKLSYNNNDEYNSNNNTNNNENKVKFNSNDNRGKDSNDNNYNSISNYNSINIKNKVNTTTTTTTTTTATTTNNNNNINSNDNNNPRTSKERKRNILWFNPPFSNNVATKIGRYFLDLIDKHFPRDRKFDKIFSRKNIKVSCSCMPNIKSAINSHNRKFLHPPVNSQSRTCNCIKKTDCPLQEKCLSENTLYQADISSENFQTKIYYGISETKFKTRYSNHKKSFNHEKHKNDTRLSNEFRKFKASKEEPVLVWKILGQYQPYNVNTIPCLLCLNEKLQIAIYRRNNMLNKRTEIISKCRHRNKYALASHDSMD